MAYYCKRNSALECDGCGKCEPGAEIVGECAACGDLIYAHEERYDIEGELIHEDCLSDWAEQFKVVI